MAKFFINRPIVAMVIALLMVIMGTVSILQLPVAQYPDIVPPEIVVQANYVGADALTIEQAVATPIEEQMSGVDNMSYMYSVNANNGVMQLHVIFDVGTDPNTDQILAQSRASQANASLPADVIQFGVTVQKSYSSPLMLISLYSPKGTYDEIVPNELRVHQPDGSADPRARRRPRADLRWPVRAPLLGQAGSTGQARHHGRRDHQRDRGAELGEPRRARSAASRRRSGQEFTYTVRSRGRLETPEEFGEIIVRANPDGSVLRLRDVARLELGAQTYTVNAALQRKPGGRDRALSVARARTRFRPPTACGRLMDELKQRFPADVAQEVSLDTTQAVREGLREIIIDAPHRHRSRGDRRVHLPAGRARDTDSTRRRSGLTHRDLRVLSAPRLFHQHPVALRPRARDRARGRRRDRRRGSGAASHR